MTTASTGRVPPTVVAATAGDSAAPGCLRVVATPLGNLADLSPRAATSLEQADVVACEDSRVSRKLYAHLGAKFPRFIVVDDHSETAAAAHITDLVAAGSRVVLISDAGAPGISDPGFIVVQAVTSAGLPIEIVPGPSAVIAALMGSGLACHRFCFEGFLPRKGSARSARLSEIAGERRCVVIFESPRRIQATLQDLAALIPNRTATVARELSKVHEEFYRGTIAQISAEPPIERGEFVIVLGEGEPAAATDSEELLDRLRELHDAGQSLSRSSKTLANETNMPRRAVYQLALDAGIWTDASAPT